MGIINVAFKTIKEACFLVCWGLFCIFISFLLNVSTLKAEDAKSYQDILMEREDGYGVELPDEILDLVPLDVELELSLIHPEMGKTSVQGIFAREANEGLSIKTDQKLRFSASDNRTLFSIADARANNGPLQSSGCGFATQPLKCFSLVWCPSQTYCLPGGGSSGGFTCVCL